LSRWCAAQRDWRFEASSVPPWTLGTMWSTSVARSRQVVDGSVTTHWHSGWRRSWRACRRRHIAPYPRWVVVPPPQARQRPPCEVMRRHPGQGWLLTGCPRRASRAHARTSDHPTEGRRACPPDMPSPTRGQARHRTDVRETIPMCRPRRARLVGEPRQLLLDRRHLRVGPEEGLAFYDIGSRACSGK
jgi:hypothetical protein